MFVIHRLLCVCGQTSYKKITRYVIITEIFATPSQPFWWWSSPSSSIWLLSATRQEVGTISATVEIIMRVVARTHRLIQLNDSFAGPKHHLRVCPGFHLYFRVCVRARAFLVGEERESEKDERTFQPTPWRVVASRNNTILLMLRLQFRHNFLSRSLESRVRNWAAIGCLDYCSVTARNVISADCPITKSEE